MHQLRKEQEMAQERRDEKLTTADIAAGQKKPSAAALQNRREEGADETAARREEHRAQLFPDHELSEYRGRWDRIQTSFVDEPRQAVEQADSLVAATIKRIAEQFADERGKLEKAWDRGDNVNTEDLRQALRRYRAFFDRLLSL